MQLHILESLRLPMRYEILARAVGEKVATLIQQPDPATADLLRTVARGVRRSGSGAFLPMYAPSGTGKTTLAQSLNVLFPQEFTPTAAIDVTEDITVPMLLLKFKAVVDDLPSNDARIVPLNLDSREGRPPTDAELGAIKDFLRRAEGSRAVLLWPETDLPRARQVAESFLAIANESHVKLPLLIGGPQPSLWPEIALETLRLANDIPDLEQMGVDPREFDVDEYSAIGDYLNAVSKAFDKLTSDLLRATEKPVRMNILFVSQSETRSVLNELTGGRGEMGLLDARSLLSASPATEPARFWENRRNDLTATIVRLEARAFTLTPAVSVPAVQLFGSPELKGILDGVTTFRSRPDLVSRLDRSEVGRYLRGEPRATSVGQGTPASAALKGHATLSAGQGFSAGKDKALNRALAQAFEHYWQNKGLPEANFLAEQRLLSTTLIPDVQIVESERVTALEQHWRTGDYVRAANKADMASYIMGKLKTYAQAFGWVGA